MGGKNKVLTKSHKDESNNNNNNNASKTHIAYALSVAETELCPLSYNMWCIAILNGQTLFSSHNRRYYAD